MTTQDESAHHEQPRAKRMHDAEGGWNGRTVEYRLRPHRHVGGPFSGTRSERQAVRHADARSADAPSGVGGADHQRRPAQTGSGVSAPAAAGKPSRVDLVLDWVSRQEHRIAGSLRRGSVPALRIALSLVFIWFGALKVTGESPVGNLVAGVAPWVPRGLFISGLGIFEVLLGVALLVGYRLVWVALLMIAHLTGTFLVFLTEPAAAFSHGNPLLVTMAGEFVAKNMVLIAGGLVLVAFAHEHKGALQPVQLAEPS